MWCCQRQRTFTSVNIRCLALLIFLRIHITNTHSPFHCGCACPATRFLTIMYSSKEIYQLNPPRNLQPSDWVIELPQPSVQSGTPLAIAQQQYQTVRLDRLIGYIENRFHNGCCFFEFLDENKDQDPLPGQCLVSNLFAYHEIEHWPGAQAHVKWTEFVMENLEYDARVEAQASEQGLTCKLLACSYIILHWC
jgi:hypothetical protein